MTPPTPTRVSTRWWLHFTTLSLIWGMSFLLIAIAGRGFTPIHLAFGRTLCAALALNLIRITRREHLPRTPRTWLHLTIGALLVNSVPFTLYALAEQRIPSALAGITNATTPLFTTAVVVAILRDEHLDRRRLTGIALGFTGTLVVLGLPGSRTPDTLTGAVMGLTAAACYGLGWPYLRHTLGSTHPDGAAAISGLSLPTAVLTAATLQTGLVAVVVEPHHPIPTESILALATLGIVGTGLAYTLQFRLLAEGGATLTSLVTYLLPVISTTAGIGLLGERLHWNEPLGTLIILTGAYLAQRTPTPHPSPPPSTTTSDQPAPDHPLHHAEPEPSGR